MPSTITHIFKPNVLKKEGVNLSSTPALPFSDLYLKVREIEDRVYSDHIVAQLPFVTSTHSQYTEWKKREKTTNRFLNYLSNRKVNNLLEIGSGNGWFSNQCAKHVTQAVGSDINLPELQQAARVFNNKNVEFLYWDLFNNEPFNEKFDLIVLNASIQYFDNLPVLFSRLAELLTKNGEIHILDSPFYKREDINKAKQRSADYYTEKGVKEMKNHYFHHSLESIKDFELIHQPSKNRFIRLITRSESPFSWYRKIVIS